MVSLARQLTTGPFVEASAFRPDGLIIRWGAGPGDITVIPTTDSVAGGDWWYRSQDIPSPRDAEPTTSPADLLWIDGSNESAVVTINAPGPLGEPHSDFASLAYVSIYQAAVARSIVPPGLEPAAPTTTTEVTPTDDEDDLPPTMPGLIEPSDEEQGTSEPLRAQISVIFDFLSPGGPRIAAVEAIWIEPSSR